MGKVIERVGEVWFFLDQGGMGGRWEIIWLNRGEIYRQLALAEFLAECRETQFILPNYSITKRIEVFISFIQYSYRYIYTYVLLITSKDIYKEITAPPLDPALTKPIHYLILLKCYSNIEYIYYYFLFK